MKASGEPKCFPRFSRDKTPNPTNWHALAGSGQLGGNCGAIAQHAAPVVHITRR